MSGGCSFPYWETKPKKNPTHLVVTATIWRKPAIQVEHERERRVMSIPQDFTKKIRGEEELIRLRPKCHFEGVEPHVHMKRFDKDRMGSRALHCELQGLKLYAHPFCCTLGFYPPHILCCSSALVHRYQFCHATLLSIWNGLPFY